MAGEFDVCFYGTTSDATVREKSTTAEISSRLSSLPRSIVERPLCVDDATVLTFDVYGTLVDRETGIVTALMPWLHDVGVTAGRSEIVRAFSLAERSSLCPGMRYRDVLVQAHDAIADFFGVRPDRKAAEEFAGSIGRWPVHPDAPAALAYLKQHFQLVVLTNSDHASFEVTNQALGVEFDAVYTAEDTGTFKPSTGMFAHLLSKLEEAGIDKRQVLHVAGSIRFDHVPAKRLGMNTCWIHRKRGPEPLATIQKHGVNVHPDFRFRTLGGLADTHWSEIREG
ncbi:MAG: haloacid dehalogenase type II [Alphaproteobacteria bacterium]